MSEEMNMASAVESTAPVASSVPVEAPATTESAEKMVPQSRVNAIAAAEKRRGYEQAQRELAQQQQQYAQTPATPYQQAPVQGQFGGIPALQDPNVAYQVNQEIDRRLQEQQRKLIGENVTRIANDFLARVQPEMYADPELAAAYDELNFEGAPNLELIQGLNALDNTTDVIRELGKNPSKYFSLLGMANTGLSKAANKELKKLSDSIKANKQAQAQPKAPEPLDQIKPPSTTMSDGKMSPSDYRKMYARQRNGFK
jgi:hypothetical protein